MIPGPDSRNDPLAIGSDTILWSWSADRIPQTPIAIGSSDRENTKPNSLLPIESWHNPFTGKFRIEITWSWLNGKCQTDGIDSWRHNGKCGDVIYECRYESVMASSVHAHSVCSRYNTVWTSISIRLTSLTPYETYLGQNTFKITTKSSDVTYLPRLWRHAPLLDDGRCSFTHHTIHQGCFIGVATYTRCSEVFNISMDK